MKTKAIRKYLKKKLCRLNTVLMFRYSCKTCKNKFVCRKSHLYSCDAEMKNLSEFVLGGGADEIEKRIDFVMDFDWHD